MVDSSYQVFVGLDQRSLEGGYVFIGSAYGNPEAAPLQVFWDEAKTVPALQPLRTSGGYIVRDGTPSNVYVGQTSYSVRVRDRSGNIVYYAGSAGGDGSSPVKFPIASGPAGPPGPGNLELAWSQSFNGVAGANTFTTDLDFEEGAVKLFAPLQFGSSEFTAIPPNTIQVTLDAAAVVTVNAYDPPIGGETPTEVTGPTFTLEQFGATGGADDTQAFLDVTAAIIAAGGGVVELKSGRTYTYGSQDEFANGVGQGRSPFMLTGLSRGFVLKGNGARIRTKAGLKYGAFDPATGNALPGQTPSIPANGPKSASPFLGVVHAQDCSGQIALYDVELDGNINNQVIGGGFGDTGIQTPHCGIYMLRCTGQLTLVNVYAHHFGLDGFLTQRTTPTRGYDMGGSLAINVRSMYNGRNGWSWVAGRRATFINCQFNHTGRNGAVASNPGAGFDIEAEGGQVIAQLEFNGCEFIDNIGAGVVSDVGVSEDIVFNGCLFVGTTSTAIFTRDPRWRFVDCTIAGTVTRCYPGSSDTLNGQRATRFVRCFFTDNADYSPTGSVFCPDYIVNLGIGFTYTLFDDCDFVITSANGRLPFTLGGERYRNCRMSQASSQPCVPSGTYQGQNFITGAINSVGVTVLEGKTNINGTDYAPAGGGAGTWAPYTPVFVTGGGSISSMTLDCEYKTKDGICETIIRATPTGAGTGYIRFSLPETVAKLDSGYGFNKTSRKGLAVYCEVADSKLYVYAADGTYPAASGEQMLIHLRYRV